MYASDDDRDELLLMDSNLFLKVIPYCNSLVLIFQYLPYSLIALVFIPTFQLTSVMALFVSLVPERRHISHKFYQINFVHCTNTYMLTAAGVWSDCRLQTYLFCWAKQSGVVRDNIPVGSVSV